MALLGTLFLQLLTGLAEVLTKFLSRKVAIASAGVVVFLGMFGALFALVSSLALGIVIALPANAGVLTGVWLAVPDNGPAVVAACIACDVAVAVFRVNFWVLSLAVAD